MRAASVLSVLLLTSLLPGVARGDACRDEIAALYAEGGAMDPFARPPHRQTVRELTADGTETRVNVSLFETPMRTIAGVPAENRFTMAIGRDLWNGPSMDGPWTPLGYQMPEGREEAMRLGLRQNAANLADTDCLGADGDGRLVYSYRTQTDPDASGVYSGAFYTVRVDPDSGRAMRIEMTDFVNSWTEGVSTDRHEITLDYDPSIRVLPPE